MSTNVVLALGAFAIGIALAVVLGNPLWLLVAALVGAISANRKRA